MAVKMLTLTLTVIKTNQLPFEAGIEQQASAGRPRFLLTRTLYAGDRESGFTEGAQAQGDQVHRQGPTLLSGRAWTDTQV